MNTQDHQHHILRTLREAAGHPLLEDVLRSQAESRIRPRPTRADLDDAIDNLRSRGFIAVVANELQPDNPYWILDERGEAYCVKARL